MSQKITGWIRELRSPDYKYHYWSHSPWTNHLHVVKLPNLLQGYYLNLGRLVIRRRSTTLDDPYWPSQVFSQWDMSPKTMSLTTVDRSRVDIYLCPSSRSVLLTLSSACPSSSTAPVLPPAGTLHDIILYYPPISRLPCLYCTDSAVYPTTGCLQTYVRRLLHNALCCNDLNLVSTRQSAA
jgi:hypothetical protein